MIEMTTYAAMDPSTDFSGGMAVASGCAACTSCQNQCDNGCIASGCSACETCSTCTGSTCQSALTDALLAQLVTNVFNSNNTAATAVRVAATTS